MVKEKRILSYFIGWLILGFIIMFVGINKIFASTYYMNYQYSQQYYDNRGSSVSAVNTDWNESLQSYVSGNITTASGSYGAGLSITSPIPIIENHTYTLSIFFEDISNLALSSKNKIAISTSLNGAGYNYANNDFYVDTVNSVVNNNQILQFVFTAKGGGNYIFIPWTTTSTVSQSYLLTQISMEDLGSEGISQKDINNSLNNQTNELNSSIQNSTNTITGAITETEDNINQNIDDMEQSIVDSNKETQDVIKDQFNSCRNSYNLLNNKLTSQTINGITITKYEDGSIELNGTSTSEFYPTLMSNLILENKIYTLSTFSNMNNDKIKISIRKTSANEVIAQIINGNSITFNNTYLESVFVFITIRKNQTFNNFIIKPMLQEGSIATKYEPYGEEICTNKLDEQNDKLNGIQGALTDSSSPDTSDLENSAGWLPAGPLDSILNLPLTMLKSLTNSLGKTCTPLNLKLPYVNKNIQIPCLSAIFAKITGVNGLWTWVGTIASVLILYNYLLNLYAWVDRVLTLRAEFDEAMGADLANWGRL